LSDIRNSDPPQARILVIDDEPGIREGCRRALRSQGCLVDTAENGEQGLAKIEQDGYDLVLIDVMMPGISGIELISHIHQHDPESVCIIITGYATIELAVAAIKQGAYDFLTKPFTTDDLTMTVNQGLERRKLSLETQRLRSIEEEARRLAEEKARLEELDRAKVTFIRLVTHELKAPISAILTYLDLILKDYIPPAEQHEYLVRAQQRANEQLELISDLLQYGRLKEIKSPAKTGWVQLDGILSEVVEQFKPQALEKNIHLTVEITPGLPPVCMDPEQVRSVWSNLISNAVKYTPMGGSITVRLCQANGNLEGRVEDTGIGIPLEAKDRLFSEFYRAKNAKALQIPGTGLGLVIVKQIVERAGGRIWFESEAGQGSTFTFVLPVEESSGANQDEL
jgi:two-component system sensor histidine kinase/response regulator